MGKTCGVIYVVTHVSTGRKYVGQTTSDDLNQYWQRTHVNRALRGSSRELHKDIRAFGAEAFVFQAVYAAFDKATLDVAENYFIIELDAFSPRGYNLVGGGHPGVGKFVSDEVRDKLRMAANAQFSAPGAREAVAERTRQQFADPDKAARHRAAYDNPDTKAKISEQNVGKRWITNGTDSRILWPGERMPEGWDYGASFTTVGASRCRWINNGAECCMVPRDAPIPEGWILGKIDLAPNARNAGMRWVTDGEHNEMVARGAPLPIGWRYGMTRLPRAA